MVDSSKERSDVKDMILNLEELNERNHTGTPTKNLSMEKEDDELDNEDRETADKPSLSNLAEDGSLKP